MSIITVAAAIWIGSSTGAASLEKEANAIYTGGDIITMIESQPSAEAIAINEEILTKTDAFEAMKENQNFRPNLSNPEP